jgi:hypothetical protein
MTQYHVLASEGRQRYIYTKINPKNIKEKKRYVQYIYVCVENSQLSVLFLCLAPLPPPSPNILLSANQLLDPRMIYV